jgi:hypothetical protein
LLGRLDVFDQTLAIHGWGLTVDRIYKRVFCVKSDVMKIIEGISKEHSPVDPVATSAYWA